MSLFTSCRLGRVLQRLHIPVPHEFQQLFFRAAGAGAAAGAAGFRMLTVLLEPLQEVFTDQTWLMDVADYTLECELKGLVAS